MRKILIAGAHSYIGTSFEKYLESFEESYSVSTLDMKKTEWKDTDFSQYDSVFHVAGLAHSDSGKISQEKEKIYKEVNTNLVLEVAKKAKSSGVKQFVFMSSIIVYGSSAPMGKNRIISSDSVPAPANCYGKSKLDAENLIKDIADSDFKVVILRPPMIYGKNSKGNYPILAKLAKKLPLFPYVKNSRSMIYIENFCEFVRLMIENEECGTFFPQNDEYVNTSVMSRTIAEVSGKKLRLTRAFNPALRVLRIFTGSIDKAFGGLCYDYEMSIYKEPYCKYSLEESIKLTES